MLNPRLLSTTPSLMSRGLPFSDLVSVIFSLVMLVSVMRAARMSSRPTYSVLGIPLPCIIVWAEIVEEVDYNSTSLPLLSMVRVSGFHSQELVCCLFDTQRSQLFLLLLVVDSPMLSATPGE